MRALSLIVLLSSLLPTAFTAPAPQATSAPALACGLAGYTKTTAAYYFDSSGTKNNFASCSAACRADTKCKSFGFGEANCMLFDVAAGDNTNLNPMSPYTFYDVACTETGAPISSSTKPPSSTQKPPSSTPKPPSSTPKPPSSTPKPPSSTPKPPTSTPKPPSSTAKPPTSTPKTSSKPTSKPPSKTSSTPTPPSKTTTGEEIGPSSTRCPVPLYYQCDGYYDGKPWTGCKKCVSGAKCIWQNDWYYQCVANDDVTPSRPPSM